MKTHYLLFILILTQPICSIGQSQVTLDQCTQAAETLSPQAQQSLYYQSIAELKRENVTKANLPQLQLAGQYTYQSDVFELPFSLPGAESPDIPKDQYKVSLNVQQKIYDGGTTQANKALITAEEKTQQQQVKVSLYQIRQVINQLYFGALLYQENEKILHSVRELLKQQLTEVQSRVENGAMLSSNANIIKKELLNKEQELISVSYDKQAAVDMLNQWTGFDITATDELVVPDRQPETNNVAINRPEVELFNLQNQQLEATKSLTQIRNTPKISAFAQGGVGSPNPYNFFETDMSEFYIAGIKLEWNFLDYNRKKNDLKQLSLQSDIINTQKEDFVRKTTISLSEEQHEIEKLRKMIDKDNEILALQQDIVKETFAQLNNGMITSTQYITELNKQTTAQLNKRIHELMLAKAKTTLMTKAGN